MATVFERLQDDRFQRVADLPLDREAGTWDDGTGGVPYFAMEHIPDARTIIEHAAAHDLGRRERLDLFARVCDAVHHGHQKGTRPVR